MWSPMSHFSRKLQVVAAGVSDEKKQQGARSLEKLMLKLDMRAEWPNNRNMPQSLIKG